MLCPLCRERPSRRACPAVGKAICAICCGTKREAEIACPSDCGYLATSHAHPPAAVRRQQERDVGLLMAMREGLSNRQSDLFWVLLTFLAGFRADPLVRLVDEDLAEAAGAMAATTETADRGLIYEHRPNSLASQRLVTELRGFLAKMLESADAATTKTVERDLAVVLRRLEKGAREALTLVPDGGPAFMLEAIGRVVAAAGRGTQATAGPEAPRIEAPSPMLIKP